MNEAAQPLPTNLPGLRPLSPQEEVQRQSAAACAASPTPNCQKVIHIGIFFDGTNNNRERDKQESPKSHTNVAVLYDAYRDDPENGRYAIYVPGVGTAFPQIGETTESDEGKTYGMGGDQRINWGLVQLVNAIHRTVYKDPLLSDQEAGVDANAWPLHSNSTIGANESGKLQYFRSGLRSDDEKEKFIDSRKFYVQGQREALQDEVKRIEAKKRRTDANQATADEQLARLKQKLSSLDDQLNSFRSQKRNPPKFIPLLERLDLALRKKPLPQVKLINLSVFGFSRGAAQARAFCRMLQNMLTHDGSGLIVRLRGKENSSYSLAGVPLRLQFLGLMDTVASVGMPAPSGLWNGLGGWANGTMDIADCVERCVHFVAGHEIRRAFPASSGRIGAKSYPRNCIEVVYPGAHSDVGGGYPSGFQGKAMFDRTRLLSQVPLVHMYMEALRSGVPLRSQEELAGSTTSREVLADLQIHPDTQKLFQRYAQVAAIKAESVEKMLQHHMRLYWRWRRQHADDYPQTRAEPSVRPERVYVSRLSSLRNASEQHRQDLIESERDFKADGVRINAAVIELKAKGGAKELDLAGADYYADLALPPVEKDVDDFFDTLVHDSHATFYMCGPSTKLDKANWYQMVKRKSESGEKLSNLEQRILAGKGDEFPVVDDSDTAQLLEFMQLYKRKALHIFGQSTRREKDGHIRYRQIFDES